MGALGSVGAQMRGTSRRVTRTIVDYIRRQYDIVRIGREAAERAADEWMWRVIHGVPSSPWPRYPDYRLFDDPTEPGYVTRPRGIENRSGW